MAILEPFGKKSILQTLDKVTKEVVYTFKSISSEDLFVRLEGGWSPLETLEHLIKSSKAVKSALKRSGIFLRLLGGKPKRTSRRYSDLQEAYLRELVSRAHADQHSPNRIEHPGSKDEVNKMRQKAMRRWKALNKEIRATLELWREKELEQYQISHPIMGKLTIREMLLLAIYHTLHHLHLIQQRIRRERKRPGRGDEWTGEDEYWPEP